MLFCSAVPWAAARVPGRVLAVVLAAFVALAATGTILGLALTAGTLVALAPVVREFAGGAFSEALVPFLAAGWLIAAAVASSPAGQILDHRPERDDAPNQGDQSSGTMKSRSASMSPVLSEQRR